MMENRNPNKTRIIALEEHYATQAFIESSGLQLSDRYKIPRGPGPTLTQRLCDIGDLRIQEMDAAGVDIQVLSLASPGVQQMKAAEAVAVAREQNDILADAIKYYPERFVGFASLPTQVPDEAAKELDRAVNELGFRGAAIMGHTQGRYLDDEFFYPVLESAAALQVPVYLHPTRPPQPVFDTYYAGKFPPNVPARLATAALGGHIETAVHALRLVAGGTFDRFPGLQIIIGHMGETLPFMLPRIDRYLPQEETYLERPAASYFRENFYYTFSGFNYLPAFLDLLLQIGSDRIMFSADYPFESMEFACRFLDQIPVSPTDKERIAHGNAERLLGVF